MVEKAKTVVVDAIVSAVPKYFQILQAVFSLIRKKSFYLWLEKYIYFILMPKRKQKARMATLISKHGKRYRKLQLFTFV